MQEEDNKGYLNALFWAYLYVIKMLKEHPNVVMLDCMYKTN
jgi:hypothetical protein